MRCNPGGYLTFHLSFNLQKGFKILKANKNSTGYIPSMVFGGVNKNVLLEAVTYLKLKFTGRSSSVQKDKLKTTV